LERGNLRPLRAVERGFGLDDLKALDAIEENRLQIDPVDRLRRTKVSLDTNVEV